jgi:hypothetical protein
MSTQQSEIKRLQALPENYGYIVFGEDRFREMRPVNLKDEFLSDIDNRWRKIGVTISSAFLPQFYNSTIYRRRIDPGEGFEIVPIKHKFAANDEQTHDGKNWHRCNKVNGFVGQWLALYPSIIAIRRRKQPVCETCGGAKIVVKKNLQTCPHCWPARNRTLGGKRRSRDGQRQ